MEDEERKIAISKINNKINNNTETAMIIIYLTSILTPSIYIYKYNILFVNLLYLITIFYFITNVIYYFIY